MLLNSKDQNDKIPFLKSLMPGSKIQNILKSQKVEKRDGAEKKKKKE